MNKKSFIIVLFVIGVCFAAIGVPGKVTAETRHAVNGSGPGDKAPVNQTSQNSTNPAPDAIWDDILNAIKNIPGSIWNWIIDAFNSAVLSLINTFFALFEILFQSPDLVGNAPLYSLWSMIVMIMDAFLGIAFVGIGIAFLVSGISPNLKAEIKVMLPNLIIFLVLGHFSIYICQFAVDLNDSMVGCVLGGGFSHYSLILPPASGIALLLLSGILLILILAVGIVLALRIVIILFSTVLMPLACLAYVFPTTRGFAKNIISMFAVWTFLTFFESIALVVAFIALATMSQWVAWLIFISALVFMTALPKMLGKGLGAGSGGSFFGIGALAGMTAMAVTGVGAGVAGATRAVKGGMAAASTAGKSVGGSVASGFAKAPMGFARGFTGSIKNNATAGPSSSGGRMGGGPVKAYRQERDRYSKNNRVKDNREEVGMIRKRYNLRNAKEVAQ